MIYIFAGRKLVEAWVLDKRCKNTVIADQKTGYNWLAMIFPEHIEVAEEDIQMKPHFCEEKNENVDRLSDRRTEQKHTEKNDIGLLRTSHAE